MKSRILLCFVVLTAVLIAVSSRTFSQEKGTKAESKPQPAYDKDAMMKKWMEAASAGENHKRLNDFAGSWETSSSMLMEGPGKPPTVSKGTAEVKWIMDGRFLLQEAKGEMMGKPWTGMGITGYDNITRLLWIIYRMSSIVLMGLLPG